MTEVFADTVFWFGRLNPDDPWHEPARRAVNALGDSTTIVTTEGVLSELDAHGFTTVKGVLSETLTLAARPQTLLRRQALDLVRDLQRDEDVIILPQTHDLFQRGLDLYARRTASTLSLQDCISMIVMRERGINDILTGDAEFRGFGFSLLLER